MNEQNLILIEILNRKDKGETCVFTNGCFDIIHAGHIYLLKTAREKGDFLVVGLNSDDSTKRLKGKNRPINNQESRRIVLMSIRYVDYVLIFDEDTPYELISLVKPDILVKGGDYTPDIVVGKDIVEGYGGLVEIVPFIDGFSSTGLIDKISNSNNQ